MYASDDIIGLAGSKIKGSFAFQISRNFYSGSSAKVETYDNEILSKHHHFKVMHLEVWAILDWTYKDNSLIVN